MFKKAHYTFLEFTTEDQFEEHWSNWKYSLEDEKLNEFYWAAMAFGNDELALAEDESDDLIDWLCS